MNQVLISFDKINLKYDNKLVFKDFSLVVQKHDKLIIHGRSGRGKSSLFSILLGFVKPDSGSLIVDGSLVDEESIWEIRKKISYVDQSISIGQGKLYEWIESVRSLRANASSTSWDKGLKELMDLFDLDAHLLVKDTSELSGGERQRMAIIVSILLGRKIFLLDVASTALDKHLKDKVADYFLSREDWTVLVISHDPVWSSKPGVKVFDIEENKWIQ